MFPFFHLSSSILSPLFILFPFYTPSSYFCPSVLFSLFSMSFFFFLFCFFCPPPLLHDSSLLFLPPQGCSSPIVVKFADTQKDKEQRRLQQQLAQQMQQLNSATTWGSLTGLGGLTPQYLAVRTAAASPTSTITSSTPYCSPMASAAAVSALTEIIHLEKSPKCSRSPPPSPPCFLSLCCSCFSPVIVPVSHPPLGAVARK